MSAEEPVDELERRLLHALLLEHDGLNVADVASELGIERARAEAILELEQRAGVVDLRVEDSVYITLRKTKSLTVSEASAALLSARRERAARQTRRTAMLVGVPLAATSIATFAWYCATRPVGPPSTAVPANMASAAAAIPASTASAGAPVALGAPSAARTLDDRVEARLAGERRRQWELDAADRERRIAELDAAANEGDCASKWNAGAVCYVSHRNMSGAEFDEERAGLTSELAKLRRLLEQSR
jgi:hypothetical protein